MSHVSSTYFLPGVEVGLYSILKRPQGPGELEPADVATVPDDGLVRFEVDAPAGQAFWLAGSGPDGRWRVVQTFAKDKVVDPRVVLEATRREDPPDLAERRVRGARGTLHRLGRPARRG